MTKKALFFVLNTAFAISIFDLIYALFSQLLESGGLKNRKKNTKPQVQLKTYLMESIERIRTLVDANTIVGEPVVSAKW